MQINTFSKIILASQSPRRVALLQQIGIECIQMPANIDETALPNEAPTDYVLRLARQKALAIAANNTDSPMPILAADTAVALDADIFGKPENDVEAFNMLKKLSGSTHQVHTAVAVSFNGKIESALNTTQVTMMRLTDAMISNYIASGEHSDKAGSYAIQGLAGCWVTHISGSYTGVMGLPVHETMALLNRIG